MIAAPGPTAGAPSRRRGRRLGRRAIAFAATLAVGAALVAQTGVAPPDSAQAVARAGDPGFSKIKHVVVIFQENRSFDETLGRYCVARANACDGYYGPVTLRNHTTVNIAPSPDVISPDPPHNMAAQTFMVDNGRMDGWNYGPCKPPGATINLCLTAYAPSQIPNLAALASLYTVSDRTFSMANSPSWGGHMWPVAASQDNFTGDIPDVVPGVPPGAGWGCDSKRVANWIDPVTKQLSQQPACVPAPNGVLDPVQYPYNGAFRATQARSIPTIMDRLGNAGLNWRFYASVYGWSICPTFAKCKYTNQKNNVVPTVRVVDDANAGRLPAFSIVLPTAPGGTGQHPPGSMLTGDNWIGQVVSSIMNGPQGKSTAIFITYDDCGCFYDHVPPGTNPDGTKQGVRVPMVIVSPYARHGFVDKKVATAASILRFTERVFGLTALGVNDAQGYDYGDSFDWTVVPGARSKFRPIVGRLPKATTDFQRAHPEAEQAAENEDT